MAKEEVENLFDKIIAGNFLAVENEMNVQAQAIQRTPNLYSQRRPLCDIL